MHDTHSKEIMCVLTMLTRGGSKPWGMISDKFVWPQAIYRFYLASTFP